MKVYIAGAITKNPNYMQQFSDAEKLLTAMGHAVINPVKNEGFSYKEYIDMGLCELMRCDAIYLLPGWRESFGAGLEYHYATITGMKILGALEDKLKQEWIPVTERLPEDNSDVLAYMQNGIESRIFPASYYKDWWEDCILNTRCLSVTHWMPLPEPPKGE